MTLPHLGKTPSFTPIHPFPARMAPSIAWKELSENGNAQFIVDPMAGSGTTLVAARLAGHKAIGFDSDPLAVLIGHAWCADVEPDELRQKAVDVVDRATYTSSGIRLGDAYPRDSDEETRSFIRFWFDEANRRQLAALAGSISRVRDPVVKELLWCAFSRLIVTKQAGASLAMDVSHSRPHRVYEKAPIRPLHSFMRSVETVVSGSPFKEGKRYAKARVALGDARQLPLHDSSVDMVITSPPYLNAIDYLRGHKFSLVWMGYTIAQLREIRSTSVGSESARGVTEGDARAVEALNRMGEIDKLPVRIRGILARYILDMSTVMSEIHRVLRPRGRVIMVVGDSSMRGVFIRNSKAIAYLAAERGLALESVQRRQLPENRRYLPPPTSRGSGRQLRKRMREEVVLRFHCEAP